MTKTNWLLTCVLVSTLFPTSIFAQNHGAKVLIDTSEEVIVADQPEISIYPVPIERIATISFNTFGDQNWKIERLSLFNLLGNAEASFTSLDFTPDKEDLPKVYKLNIDFSPLQSGIYFFRIEYKNKKTGKKFEDTRKVTYNG